jgi:DNA-directed RNA polymerase specialized sigma24 family protein
MLPDLEQAALIGALKALPYWRADGGKSVFNWCAGPMKREMMKVVRSHFGYRPCGSDEIRDVCDSFDDSEGVEEVPGYLTLDLEERIDLKRILANDPKPQHVLRFIASTLSPSSGADLARGENISRQAICSSNRRTRQRLREAFG